MEIEAGQPTIMIEVSIIRAATGQTETYQLIGTVDDGSNALDDGTQRDN